VGCRQLLKLESILAGGSSGAIVSALLQDKLQLREHSTCVLLLADRGERYLETIYSDEWVAEHFGQIPSLDTERCKVATF